SWTAGITPRTSGSRPRRPTPGTPTWAGTRSCWCFRLRPRIASARTPGSIPSSDEFPTRGSSTPRPPSEKPAVSPPGGMTSTFGPYYEALVQRLNALYDTHPDSAALEAGRAEAGAWARAQLQGPVGAQLRTLRVGKLAERPVNNARLIGARIYRTRLDLFESWY